MIRLLAQVRGLGIETADMLVREVLSRRLRDRRAVARYGGLTGSPDESGACRREKGLARAGNSRVRRGMIQLAWRFLMFQENSAPAQWDQTRTASNPWRHLQSADHRLGARAARCSVAPGHDWRGAARGRAASGAVSRQPM